MRGNRKTGTKPEVRLRSALHRRGLRFRRNHLIVLGGGSVRPDAVFTRARLAVFVDGCFWHRCPAHSTSPRSNVAYWGSKFARNVERDRCANAALAAEGWIVVRFWEHQVRDDLGGASAVVEQLFRQGHALHAENVRSPRPSRVIRGLVK
jgi:DNA mismatch endonuclease (patch repair protein)